MKSSLKISLLILGDIKFCYTDVDLGFSPRLQMISSFAMGGGVQKCKMQSAKCKMQWKEEKIEFQVPVDFYMTSTKVKGEKFAGFTFTGQKLGEHRL